MASYHETDPIARKLSLKAHLPFDHPHFSLLGSETFGPRLEGVIMPPGSLQVLQALDRRLKTRLLKNGLRVYHVPRPSSQGFHIGITFKAGVRDETEANNGISHFLEHLIFRGSRSYPSFLELAQAFEALGGEWNAATGYETTEYWYSGVKVYAQESIRLFGEFLKYPLFKDFAVEREVILRERLKEYNELDLNIDIDHLAQRVFWQNSSLALPIIGTEESLSAIRLEDIRAHRLRHYRPDRAVLLAVGGDADDRILAGIEEVFADYFEGIESPAAPQPWTKPEGHCGPQFTWQENPDNEFEILLSFRFDFGEEDSRMQSLGIMSRILGDGYSARLCAHLRERLGLVYDIDVGPQAFRDVGSFDVHSSMGEGQLIKFFSELFRMLRELKDQGVTEEECEFYKKRAMIDGRQAPESNEWVSNRLGSWALYGRQPQFQRAYKNLAKLKATHINEVLRELFKPERGQIVIVGPKNSTLESKLRELAAEFWKNL